MNANVTKVPQDAPTLNSRMFTKKPFSPISSEGVSVPMFSIHLYFFSLYGTYSVIILQKFCSFHAPSNRTQKLMFNLTFYNQTIMVKQISLR